MGWTTLLCRTSSASDRILLSFNLSLVLGQFLFMSLRL
jgi:hypothetical protein